MSEYDKKHDEILIKLEEFKRRLYFWQKIAIDDLAYLKDEMCQRTRNYALLKEKEMRARKVILLTDSELAKVQISIWRRISEMSAQRNRALES